jgi:hypothetical protein
MVDANSLHPNPQLSSIFGEYNPQLSSIFGDLGCMNRQNEHSSQRIYH